jgi:hypothetical protein
MHCLLMRAHYIMASERWADSMITWTIDTTGVDPVSQAADAFALGYAALRRDERPIADAQLRRITALAGRTRAADDDYNPQSITILRTELQAAIRAAEGGAEDAVALLRQATAIEDTMAVAFGPPDVVKPSHEMLGELLLSQHKAPEAQQEFVRALRLAPRRTASLVGLARAASAAGDTPVADQARLDLAANLRHADADLPALSEIARRSAQAR